MVILYIYGFNSKMIFHDLDDLGACTPILGHPKTKINRIPMIGSLFEISTFYLITPGWLYTVPGMQPRKCITKKQMNMRLQLQPHVLYGTITFSGSHDSWPWFTRGFPWFCFVSVCCEYLLSSFNTPFCCCAHMHARVLSGTCFEHLRSGHKCIKTLGSFNSFSNFANSLDISGEPLLIYIIIYNYIYSIHSSWTCGWPTLNHPQISQDGVVSEEGPHQVWAQEKFKSYEPDRCRV